MKQNTGDFFLNSTGEGTSMYYYQVWEHYSANKATSDLRLSEFLQELEPRDLFHFVEDAIIFSPENSSIKNIFRAFNYGIGFELEDSAFDMLTNVSEKQAARIAQSFEQIFDKALNKAYADQKNLDAIAKIKALTSANKIGLSENYIIHLIEDKNMDLDWQLRLQLLALLPQLAEKKRINHLFWKNWKSRLVDQPTMGPAVVLALKKDYPFEALEVLTYYNNYNSRSYPELLTYFYLHVRTALYNFLNTRDKEPFRQFLNLRKKITVVWINNMLDKILSEDKFEDITAELNKVQQHLWFNSEGDKIPTPFKNRFERAITLAND